MLFCFLFVLSAVYAVFQKAPRHSAQMTFSITTFCIKCHYAECRNLFIVILNVSVLSVVALSVAGPFK
jgi:hypothetical protein